MTARRRNSYLTLITIGGIALLVDRLFFVDSATTPEMAIADVLPVRNSDATVASLVKVSSPNRLPNIPFPQALPRFQAGDFVDNLFLPPHLRHDPRYSPGEENGEKSSGLRSDGSRMNVVQFRTHHSLTGVILNESIKLAIVNGRWIQKGQSLSGCSLSSISGTEAHFTCADGVAVLPLADVPTKSPR